MTQQDVTTEVFDGGVIVRIAGEVDLANVHDVEQQVRDATAHAGRIVIDLTKLTYLDSAALAMLHKMWLDRESDDVRLVVPDEAIARRLLVITGLDAVIPVDATVEDAVHNVEG